MAGILDHTGPRGVTAGALAAALFLATCGNAQAATPTELRAARYASTAVDPVSAEYTPRVSIVASTGATAAGVLAGGTVLQGKNPGNQAGMRWYAFGDSFGSNPDGTAVAKLGAAYGWNYANWFLTQGSWAGYGQAALGSASNTGDTTVAIRTNAAMIGVAAGGGAPSTIRVYVDLGNGQGYRTLTPRFPPPTSSQYGNTIYFAFDRADPNANAPKDIQIVASNGGLRAIALSAGATLSPVSTPLLTMGSLGDSLGTYALHAAHRLSIFAKTDSSIGGTGYAAPLNYRSDYQPASSNADTDVSRSRVSIAGNVGFAPAGAAVLRAPDPNSRLDRIVAAAPDTVWIAAGTNDPYQIWAASTWNFENAVDYTFGYLRARLPDAILVVVSPWTGANRCADGLSGGSIGGGDAMQDASVQARLARQAGPWIFISNRSNAWYGRRADGSTFSGTTGTDRAWVRGGATASNPYNDSVPPNAQNCNDASSNASSFVTDGTHVTGSGSATLSASVSVSASFSMPLSSVAQMPYYGGVYSVQPGSGPVLNYANEVVVNCAEKSLSTRMLLSCTSEAPNGTVLAAGSRVYLRELVIPDGTYRSGIDYYGARVAAALAAAFRALGSGGQ